ncbi:hypothetical protein [Gimesia sp.]|uniref:hypothetical protein n=1 Tax=Gimesia sp. TaxID=2024833 RepID=UPI0025B8DF0F|nr:hypothetical protein [Gimesia sp.]
MTDNKRWLSFINSWFLLGLCLCLATACGSSSPSEKQKLIPLHEINSSTGQESGNRDTVPRSTTERRTPKISSYANPPATPSTSNSTELVFKIVALHKNVKQFLEKSEKNFDLAANSAQRSLDSTLQKNFGFYQPGSVRVDLRQNRLTLRLTSEDVSDLVRKINEVCYQHVTIAPLDKTLRETLAAESGENSLVKQELHYFLLKVSPEYQSQVDQNFQIGSEALRLILNERFKSEVPEYVPDSLKLNLKYRRMIFQVITYPSSNLGIQINNLYELPVAISAMPYRIIELRTEQQLNPSQVTYQITSIDDFENRQIQNSHSYTFWRTALISSLQSYLETKSTGYIQDTLDVDLLKKTATFQLDHIPDIRFTEQLNKELLVKLQLSNTPISIEPPGPVFWTPNRPMKRVVLKITNAEELLTNPFYRGNVSDVNTLQNIHSDLDYKIDGGLPGYFKKSVSINFDTMELAFLIDRVPPADLIKMVNEIDSLGVLVADEPISVDDFEYDPESYEKTMYFSFVDSGQPLPEYDEIEKMHSANMNLCGVDGYIPHTLQMDFEHGILNFKVRVGGNESKEIEYIINVLSAIMLECKYLSTTLPASNGKGNPLQPGMTARRTADPAPIKENVKVTVKYGLFGGGSKGKPLSSARDALDGFSWIDLKTLKFNEGDKEFSFETTGPFNRGALERSLKRQKFYQCVISHEALMKKEEPKEE